MENRDFEFFETKNRKEHHYVFLVSLWSIFQQNLEFWIAILKIHFFDELFSWCWNPYYSTFAIKRNSIFEGKCCKFVTNFPFYRNLIYTKRCKNPVSALKSDKFSFFTNLRFCKILMKFPFYRECTVLLSPVLDSITQDGNVFDDCCE